MIIVYSMMTISFHNELIVCRWKYKTYVTITFVPKECLIRDSEWPIDKTIYMIHVKNVEKQLVRQSEMKDKFCFVLIVEMIMMGEQRETI